VHLYQLAVQNRASHDEPARNRPILGFCAYRTLDPAKAQAIAVANENFGILGLAKFCDSLANGGKHWLQVDRRARDDLENVTGRGLIIESLLELALLGLHLIEQPHVLDRDHRLVGEGCDEIDFLLSERVDRRSR